MPKLTFNLKHPDDLLEVLMGLSRVSEAQMRRYSLPPLYQSGVRYKREFPREEWLSYTEMLQRGVADCEDLAAARAAELRLSGTPAVPAIYRTRSGGWHAVVYLPQSNRIEDPSKKLGMGRRTRK